MERIACNPTEDCKYYPDCYEDVHHLYYPANEYKGTVEKTFRDLDENKQRLCRELHELRHLTEEPPVKPSREVMVHTIRSSDVYISSRLRKALGA